MSLNRIPLVFSFLVVVVSSLSSFFRVPEAPVCGLSCLLLASLQFVVGSSLVFVLPLSCGRMVVLLCPCLFELCLLTVLALFLGCCGPLSLRLSVVLHSCLCCVFFFAYHRHFVFSSSLYFRCLFSVRLASLCSMPRISLRPCLVFLSCSFSVVVAARAVSASAMRGLASGRYWQRPHPGRLRSIWGSSKTAAVFWPQKWSLKVKGCCVPWCSVCIV